MIRIQTKRTKGFRLQDQSPDDRPVVYVGRPTVFGNPWIARRETVNGWVCLDPDWQANPKRYYCSSKKVAARLAVRKFRAWLKSGFAPLDLERLRGKHLACWCPPGLCHADVLLELANREET